MKKILVILLSFCSIIGYGQLDITKRKVTLDSLNARQGVIHVNDSIKVGNSGARIESIQASNDSLWFVTNLGTIAVPANLNDDIQALYDTVRIHKDTLLLHESQIASILSDLDTKLNETDTTTMLAPYAKQSALEDTASAIRGDFPESTDSSTYSDTASVLNSSVTDERVFFSDNGIAIGDPDMTFSTATSRLRLPIGIEVGAIRGTGTNIGIKSGNLLLNDDNSIGIGDNFDANAILHIDEYGVGDVPIFKVFDDSSNFYKRVIFESTLVLSDGYEINAESDLGSSYTTTTFQTDIDNYLDTAGVTTSINDTIRDEIGYVASATGSTQTFTTAEDDLFNVGIGSDSLFAVGHSAQFVMGGSIQTNDTLRVYTDGVERFDIIPTSDSDFNLEVNVVYRSSALAFVEAKYYANGEIIYDNISVGLDFTASNKNIRITGAEGVSGGLFTLYKSFKIVRQH